jgi:uncharacterized phage-associated protein
MIIPTAKIKAILLYFSNYTNTKFLGKIKLMKLFYFLDFDHIRLYGTPVTYDTYYHLDKGPIPSYIMNLINEASEETRSILSDTLNFRTPPGTRMVQALPVRKFTEKDAAMFTDSELKILKEVCNRFKDSTMEQIKKASHNEAPWIETRSSQIIPYSLAAKNPKSKFTAEEIEFSIKISE